MIIPSEEMDYLCEWVEFMGPRVLEYISMLWLITIIAILQKIFLRLYLEADVLPTFKGYIEFCDFSIPLAIFISLFFLGLVMVPALTIISYGLMVQYISPKVQALIILSLFLMISYCFRIWNWRKHIHKFLLVWLPHAMSEYNKNKRLSMISNDL